MDQTENRSEKRKTVQLQYSKYFESSSVPTFLKAQNNFYWYAFHVMWKKSKESNAEALFSIT